MKISTPEELQEMLKAAREQKVSSPSDIAAAQHLDRTLGLLIQECFEYIRTAREAQKIVQDKLTDWESL